MPTPPRDIPSVRRRSAARMAVARSFVEAQRRRVREEVASAVTHGAGLVFALVAAPLLITLGYLHGSSAHVAAFALYGATLVLLYTASTLYHAFREPNAKRLLRILDHAAIYLLIAGSYTPVALLSLDGWLSWAVLAGIWTLALMGCVFKVFCIGRFERTSVALYLGMGWLGVLILKPVVAALPPAAVLWLVAGGLLYTIGVVFYAWERLPYNHAVWHLFVLGGSISHFVAISGYLW